MTDEKAKDAGAPEIEITPEMIDAGVDAWYGEIVSGNGPSGDMLRCVLAKVFLAMVQAAHCDDDTIVAL
jgi:hypothetical protein